MRSDAQQNYSHIVSVARQVIAERGAEASMRDIARTAEVGLATLFRHFPTREALLNTLLSTSLGELTDRAAVFEASSAPDVALVSWLREAVAFVRVYSGIVSMMAAALSDPSSALHLSCENLRIAGTRLLERAQAAGMARKEMTGSDLFALIAALGWLGDQPSFAPRSDYLFEVISNAVLRSERTD
jgi:AcrR family transcriptional regulator